ncbi:hypothetical protein WJX81_001122 [Elliptochloris bilobata]|uniref:Uncharacterized protein n=1 Tax=Elliptochloris bilobata TaxID=381761 RepID=A0AAW1S2X2_9CHLO
MSPSSRRYFAPRTSLRKAFEHHAASGHRGCIDTPPGETASAGLGELSHEVLQLLVNSLAIAEWARTLAQCSGELRAVPPEMFVYHSRASHDFERSSQVVDSFMRWLKRHWRAALFFNELALSQLRDITLIVTRLEAQGSLCISELLQCLPRHVESLHLDYPCVSSSEAHVTVPASMRALRIKSVCIARSVALGAGLSAEVARRGRVFQGCSSVDEAWDPNREAIPEVQVVHIGQGPVRMEYMNARGSFVHWPGMETHLTYDNKGKQLGILVKERFTTDQSLQLKVTGVLNTANGRFEFATSLRKLFALRPRGRPGAPGTEARKDRGRACLGAGVSYLSGADDMLCGLVMRKAIALGNDDTWLKAKAQVDYNTQSQKVDGVGRVQLARTIYNFTDTQDVRAVIGYRVHVDKNGRTVGAYYGRLQENNWSLNTDFRGWWGVRYDL